MQSHDDWGNSEDEKDMCEAADAFEQDMENAQNQHLWSDCEDDQAMCDAVDNFEQQNNAQEQVPPNVNAAQDVRLVSPQINQIGRAGADQVQSALNNAVTTVTFNPTNNTDILVAFRGLEQRIINSLTNRLNRNRGIRAYLTTDVSYNRETIDGVQQLEQHLRSSTLIFNSVDDIEENVAEMMREIFARSEEFEAQGSGWNFEKVLNIKLHMATYVPLSGSSYIPTPKAIQATRGVLNIANEDEKCIIWCIIAQLYPAKNNPCKVYNYRQFEHKIITTGVRFPTPVKDVIKLERLNDISINVFGYDSTDKLYPLYKTKHMKQKKHVNLLMIAQGDNRHYCLIKNFSRLMAYRTKHKAACFYCFNCLHGFSKKRLLHDHEKLCNKQKMQSVSFPEKAEDKEISFKNLKKQLPVPFVIYADFECYTTKVDLQQHGNSKLYQKHVPSGFSYIVVCSNPQYTGKPVVYRGDNVVDKFFELLLEEHHVINCILRDEKPMVLTAEDACKHVIATECFICEELILDEPAVRDHDHLTGKYRGAAHSKCNLQYKYQKINNSKQSPSYMVPVVFHNLRGYDAHLLMSGLGKYKNRRISCIANNSERYVSFSLGGLRFIDSLQFMSASLESLVKNLAKEEFKLLSMYNPNQEQRNMLLRKGVYPYDYVDSPEKLTEVNLPRKEEFFSELYNEEISDCDYDHALKVWNAFHCKTLGDYHDVYLKSDVLLLADVFESFRNMAISTYKLDPAHYFTAPGLSWDAMLKLTNVKLQLIDDPDMYLMIESGVRGGVSMITKKHAKANNSYCEGYDASKPSNYLIYLDANNLYGWAMSQKLPEKNFKWVEHVESFNVNTIADDSDVGYILEVDLHYPSNIHDLHSDLPVASESRAIVFDDLSPYSKHLHEKLKIKGRAHAKLVPTLHDKDNYVLHYRNLKQYLALGLQVKKIHRILSFNQSFWLNRYISMNTEKRKFAQNSFEKDFFKLMNNSIFGKTMENVRGRRKIELVHTEKRMKKIASKPSFNRVDIFNEHLVAAHCFKTNIVFDKPIFVGFSILDLSKTLMYDFHYGYIKAKYGDKASLCFTDTDSLFYDVTCDDIYKDMAEDSTLFDFSDYPSDHPLYTTENKKVIIFIVFYIDVYLKSNL